MRGRTMHVTRRRLFGLAPLALLGALSLGGPAPALAQQATANSPSIAVTATGEAGAPADGAVIQLVVQAGGGAVPVESDSENAVKGAGGPPEMTLTAEDVQPVVDALVAGGIDESAIEVVITPSGPFFGPFAPGSAQVLASADAERVGVVSEAVQRAIDAGTEAGLVFAQAGVGYTVTSCEEVELAALRDAVAKAEQQAQQLAEVLGVQLGELVLASRAPSYGQYGGGPGGGSGCEGQPSIDSVKEGLYLPPFNPAHEAEVEIYATVNLSWAIG